MLYYFLTRISIFSPSLYIFLQLTRLLILNASGNYPDNKLLLREPADKIKGPKLQNYCVGLGKRTIVYNRPRLTDGIIIIIAARVVVSSKTP